MVFDPIDCPYYLVSRATLVITAVLKRELAAAGVSHVRPAYLGALMSLWREDGLKVVELGRRARLEASTMTGLLDRMERDGLVRRAPDPDDRRALRVHLTELGRTGRQRAEEVVDRTLATMMTGVSETDLRRAKETLRQILENADRQGALP